MCLRNLSALLPQDEQGVALVALGEGFAQLTLTCQGVLYLARRIDLERRAETSSEGEGAQAAIAALALELQRSLDYYESHYDRPPISTIVVACGAERGPTLVTELAAATGLAVAPMELHELFEIADHVEPDLRWPGLLALGAALRVERSGP